MWPMYTVARQLLYVIYFSTINYASKIDYMYILIGIIYKYLIIHIPYVVLFHPVFLYEA